MKRLLIVIAVALLLLACGSSGYKDNRGRPVPKKTTVTCYDGTKVKDTRFACDKHGGKAG